MRILKQTQGAKWALTYDLSLKIRIHGSVVGDFQTVSRIILGGQTC
jgi:hypothetical protein